MVWYSYLFENFPQIVVMHTVKSFSIVNKADVDVFLELSGFFNDPMNVGNLISAFSNSLLAQLVKNLPAMQEAPV